MGQYDSRKAWYVSANLDIDEMVEDKHLALQNVINEKEVMINKHSAVGYWRHAFLLSTSSMSPRSLTTLTYSLEI